MGHILSCDNTTSGLNGKIPVFLKAAIMLLTVILLLYTDAINIGKQLVSGDDTVWVFMDKLMKFR